MKDKGVMYRTSRKRYQDQATETNLKALDVYLTVYENNFP